LNQALHDLFRKKQQQREKNYPHCLLFLYNFSPINPPVDRRRHITENYSRDKATTGSRRAAFLAGRKPKRTPMAVEQRNALTMAVVE
jgi:hypothetical protein